MVMVSDGYGDGDGDGDGDGRDTISLEFDAASRDSALLSSCSSIVWMFLLLNRLISVGVLRRLTLFVS